MCDLRVATTSSQSRVKSMRLWPPQSWNMRFSLDESKNNKPVVITLTTPIYVIHSLRAFIPKCNGQNNNNKRAMHIKTPVCNALAVAHKCNDLLPIKTNMTIKWKRNETKRYTIFIPKTTLKSNSFTTHFKWIFFWLNYWRVFHKHHTDIFFCFNLESYCKLLSETNLNPLSINTDEELNYWFFAISSLITTLSKSYIIYNKVIVHVTTMTLFFRRKKMNVINELERKKCHTILKTFSTKNLY